MTQARAAGLLRDAADVHPHRVRRRRGGRPATAGSAGLIAIASLRQLPPMTSAFVIAKLASLILAGLRAS
ncbi:hypothetical protein L083_2104 [Actinoplanes sp. N902-109]|nr:hypothetical protein L083_2104 [Actinoplanes sp. N902-109]